MNERLLSLLSRKFLAVVLTLASATWLVASKHIADGVYSAVVIAAVVAFITGNVMQKNKEAAP